MRKQWQILNQNPEKALALSREAKISVVLAQLLLSRGIDTRKGVRRYLYPTIDDLPDPLEFDGVEKAVSRIRTAQENNERVCVYGDYDADGTTATALLLDVFEQLGIDTTIYIPDRFKEGYGLNAPAIHAIKENEISLIVTVDCGLSANKEIQLAKGLGIDIIVTDHHVPRDDRDKDQTQDNDMEVRDAIPYSTITENLAGVGLAFTLAHALLPTEKVIKYLDLVCLGSIVDMSPITEHNRLLTRLGLLEINQRKRPGIKALCDVAKYDPNKAIVSKTLGFVLGPRVNAAGRMDSAHTAVELFYTKDEQRAKIIAEKLQALNQERQKVSKWMYEEAEQQVGSPAWERGIVVASDGWHKGVVGITATKLVQKFYRPSIVLSVDRDHMAYGSGRSIEGVNLVDVLGKCSHLLTKYGGHEMAVGLSLEYNNLEAFIDQFNVCLPDNMPEVPNLDIHYDTVTLPYTAQEIDELNLLEPFGKGNEKPTVIIKCAELMRPAECMGTDNKHLKMRVMDGIDTIDVVGWKMGDYEPVLRGDNVVVHLVGELNVNRYRENITPQLILTDMRREPQ